MTGLLLHNVYYIIKSMMIFIIFYCCELVGTTKECNFSQILCFKQLLNLQLITKTNIKAQARYKFFVRFFTYIPVIDCEIMLLLKEM